MPGRGLQAGSLVRRLRLHILGWTAHRMVLAIILGIAVASFGLPLVLPPLRLADETFSDLLIGHFSPPEPQHRGIAMVAIGEDSFVALTCRSPVDRAFLADLIERLRAAKVRAIGIDILFDQPTIPENDERLRRRLSDPGVPVVAISALERTALTERQHEFLRGFLAGVPHGYANLAKDTLDGAVRWHVPASAEDGSPSFPARLAATLGIAAPAEPFRIDWRNGPQPGTPPFPVYPAELVPLLPPDWLAGKVVLVGTVLSGTDLHRTPLSPSGASMPGVEIQAHVLAQLLDGRVNRRLSMPGQALLTLAASAAGVALAVAGLPLWLLALAGSTILFVLWSGSAALFAGGGALIPLLSPTLALAGGLAGMTAHRSLRERTDRRTLMALFANHVSEPVADEIWRERATFMAGGRPKPQQLTATVLFSDIKGFTTICEALPPDALIRWLDTYLDLMVGIASAHDGVVLRFIGDAVLAVFGAPVARTSQAEIDADAARAVDCAVAMGRALEALNRRYETEDLPPIIIRIGIHTGPLVVGSLGGARHREYSLLGDTANTAARLEAYAKEVAEQTTPHCQVIVGEPTWNAVSARLRGTPVGELMLKGKRNPVRVWLVRDGDPFSGQINERSP
jgi:adenylate cyclase